MAYGGGMGYHLHMPSYFWRTFTEYPYITIKYLYITIATATTNLLVTVAIIACKKPNVYLEALPANFLFAFRRYRWSYISLGYSPFLVRLFTHYKLNIDAFLYIIPSEIRLRIPFAVHIYFIDIYGFLTPVPGCHPDMIPVAHPHINRR